MAEVPERRHKRLTQTTSTSAWSPAYPDTNGASMATGSMTATPTPVDEAHMEVEAHERGQAQGEDPGGAVDDALHNDSSTGQPLRQGGPSPERPLLHPRVIPCRRWRCDG